MSDDAKEVNSVGLWLNRLQRESEAHKEYRDRAKRALTAYQKKPEQGFPIWWNNTKITQGAVFSRQPKPDVRRRVTDGTADQKIATVIERAIAYQQDMTPFDDHSTRSVNDFLVTGLGVTRLYLKTETEQQPVINPITQQPLVDDQGEMVMKKVIASQNVCLEYVPSDLFRWEPCKDWDEVKWVSFDRWMSAAEIKAEFGVDLGEANEAAGDDGNKSKPSGQKYKNLHLVHEIHDRRTKQIITICATEKHKKPLKEEGDKYKLQGFFPCGRPMMLNILAGELTPCPEYHYIDEMCTEIDDLTQRIRASIKGIKDVGFYDAAFTELADMMAADDGARIPIAGLVARLEGNSLKNVLALEDIGPKVEALVQLGIRREAAKVELFEMTGIADILRGATKASETYGAQQLKAQWANVRLTEKMREISMHFRMVFRIMGELICEHFERAQLSGQSGMEVTEAMHAVMKSDRGRCYTVDIEADSTIAQDEQQDKEDRNELLEAITNAISTLSPLVQSGFMTADAMNQLLLFTIRTHRHGRTLEETFENLPGTLQQLQQLQGQVQQGQQAQQQIQAQAEQQAQAAQQQLAEFQQQAQSALDDQARTIEQQAQKLAQLEAQLSYAKQAESYAKARDINAAADLKEQQVRTTATQNALDVAGMVPIGAA